MLHPVLPRVLLLIVLMASGAARAQGGPPPALPPAPTPGLTAGQAQSVLEVLRDDRRRAEFLATLEALARVAPAGQATPTAAPTAAPTPATTASPAAPASPATHEVGVLATRAFEHHIERRLRAVAMFERH